MNLFVFIRAEDLRREQRLREILLGVSLEAVVMAVHDLAGQAEVEIDGRDLFPRVKRRPDSFQFKQVAAAFMHGQIGGVYRRTGREYSLAALDAPACKAIEEGLFLNGVAGFAGLQCIYVRFAQRMGFGQGEVDRLVKRRQSAYSSVRDDILLADCYDIAEIPEIRGKRVGGIPDGTCQTILAAVFDGGNPDRAADGVENVKGRLILPDGAGRLERFAGAEIGDLPDIALHVRQLDHRPPACQHLIYYAGLRNAGRLRRGHGNGIKRIFRKHRLIGQRFAAGKIARAAILVGGQIIDIAVVAPALRTQRDHPLAGFRAANRGTVRPELVGGPAVRVREEQLAGICRAVKAERAVDVLQLRSRDIIPGRSVKCGGRPLGRFLFDKQRLSVADAVISEPEGLNRRFICLVCRVLRVRSGFLRLIRVFLCFFLIFLIFRVFRFFRSLRLCRGLLGVSGLRAALRQPAGQLPGTVAQGVVNMRRVCVRAGQRLRIHRDGNGRKAFLAMLMRQNLRQPA